MMEAMQDDPIELYRQRARWFLLLGAVLGAIIALSALAGFVLEIWGRHIGGGSGENVQGITWGMGVAIFLSAVVIAFLVWRAMRLLRAAERMQAKIVAPVEAAAPGPISAAVATWKSAAIARQLSPGAMPAAEPALPAHPVPPPSAVSETEPSVESSVRQTLDAIELTVVFGRSESTFPEAMQALGSARVESEALWTGSADGEDQLHLVVRDASTVEPRLLAAGLRVVARQPVLVVEIEDRPGAAGELFRRLSDAGVKVGSAHLASNTRMVLATTDPDAIRRAL